ncbi:MAG: cobyric acid synthase CobQ, partial [Alphaproteobacteria bacterium]|nr:cobyric acid synthase CobQ [Alphaproteobacteria bacterium]
RPFLTLAGRPDGAMSADGRVAGCYLHGLFAADGFRRTFLPGSTLDWEAGVEIVLDRLADHLERHVDLDRLWEIAGGR